MRSPSTLPLLLLLAIVVLAGCTSTASSPRAARGSIDRITFEEIRVTTHGTALEVVQSLRPQWLRQRAPSSFSGVADLVVYVDEVRLGPVSALASVSAQSIDYVQRISATDATQRWGTDHAGGVIFVRTRVTR
jgi:hypothetical protein